MPFINGIGPMELIIILIIALIVVGPGKLPDVGAALGKSIREFRKAATDVKEATSLEPTPAAPTAMTSAAAATAATVPAAPAPAAPAPVTPVPVTPAPVTPVPVTPVERPVDAVIASGPPPAVAAEPGDAAPAAASDVPAAASDAAPADAKPADAELAEPGLAVSEPEPESAPAEQPTVTA